MSREPQAPLKALIRYGDAVLFFSDDANGFLQGTVEGRHSKLTLAQLSKQEG